MYEVELKVRAAHDGVRDRLAALDADHTASVRQVDTYYDAPHRDFARTDEALRVRRETRLDPEGDTPDGDERRSDDGRTETRITYKGPLVEAASKTREEFETAVADPEAAAGILAGLGFDPAATVEKDREFYAVDGYTVTLDAVEGLGEFVEVEREAAEADVEAVREGAVAVLSELGLDADDQIRTSYLGLLLAEDERDTSQ